MVILNFSDLKAAQCHQTGKLVAQTQRKCREKTPTEVKVPSENDNNNPALPETGEQSGKLTTITGLLALASVVLGTRYYKKSQKD